MKNSFKKESGSWVYYVVGATLFLVPFIFLAFYNHSGAADDLSFASFYPDGNYWDKIDVAYHTYVGRYFNAFFFCLPNQVFMEVWFAQIHPVVDLTLLFFGIRFLLKNSELVQFEKVFKLSTLTLILLLAFIPQITTVYWFSGSTVYFFPLSGLFFIYGYLLKEFKKGIKVYELIITVILILAVCGSNEIYMVYVLLASVIHLMYCFYYKKKQKWQGIIFLMVSIYGNWLVLSSPATTSRIEGESFRYTANHIGDTIASFLPTTLHLIWNFLFLKGMIVLLFLLLVGESFLIPKESRERKVELLFVSFKTFLLIMGGVFIFLYSFGISDPILPRVENVFFIIFLLFLLALGLYLKEVFFGEKTLPGNQLIFWIGLCAFIFFKSENVPNVYSDLLEGKAKTMQEESIWRFNYLENSLEKEVVLPKLTALPKSIMAPEYGADKNDWTNKLLATLYNKNSVIVNHNLSMNDIKIVDGQIQAFYVTNGMELNLVDNGNTLIIKNISGLTDPLFYVHIYPKNTEHMSLSDSTSGIVNKTIQSPPIDSVIKVELPNFEISKISLGQFNTEKRLWNYQLDYKLAVRNK